MTLLSVSKHSNLGLGLFQNSLYPSHVSYAQSLNDMKSVLCCFCVLKTKKHVIFKSSFWFYGRLFSWHPNHNVLKFSIPLSKLTWKYLKICYGIIIILTLLEFILFIRRVLYPCHSNAETISLPTEIPWVYHQHIGDAFSMVIA